MSSHKTFYREILFQRYSKVAVDRKEVAEILNISLSQVDKLLKAGIGLPPHKRIGKSKRARIIFPITGIAEFLSLENTQQDYFSC